MRREEKSDLISALQSSLKEANGVFVIENHGLTVREMEVLRNELRPLVSVFKQQKKIPPYTIMTSYIWNQVTKLNTELYGMCP